ncbi:hypothetical protein APR41_06800 [Salegentibacter salinarum]|uniref:DUF4249 domain-containing protein n=1 Tax=Salegentibacter salinarum TaxID=447422 RepID=A0A2N0TR11_9FLAO|nr:DUF4249 domain-containing protein [Salegentibacter salinarum]PKD17136.1 hypothetical protein APR41_06800 [Salegentibacter salinarum]SKB55493.1 protein of unknown function [Salegentibacter salinarum]
MKLILKYKSFFTLIALITILASCVEEIPIENESFEKALVIEGSVTNEMKQHQIKLSQAFAIDTSGPNPLSGANLSVNEFVFEENQPGIYVSRDSFAAQPGVDYQLNISVNENQYESQPMQLTGTSSIGELQADRIDYRGEDGVAITLNNQTSAGTANYYRYEYTETFKFNANYFKVNDLILVDGEPVEIPKQKEEYTCYQTNESQDLILANTNSLSEDSVNDLLIKFIDSDNPSLSNRYSLLVKQYVISREAYNYYEILQELSGSDNLFSQSQPGFFAGNISNVNNPNEKIIGYFDVASVSTKRIYFNYEDFYDPESIRPTFVSLSACEVTLPDIPTLIAQLEQNAVKWSETLPGNPPPVPPYLVVPTQCVDCTLFGTNEEPDFWED